jgi:hypothetical protein
MVVKNRDTAVADLAVSGARRLQNLLIFERNRGSRWQFIFCKNIKEIYLALGTEIGTVIFLQEVLYF